MNMRARWILSMAFLGLFGLHASAQDGPGLRAGIGTDVTGGIAYGVTVSYTRVLPVHAWEFGLSFYGGSFEEDTDEDINSYHEETDIGVFAVMANYLFNYSKGAKTTYMMLGAGAGAFSVDWTESSETDTSLGTPFGANGSSQSEDGSSGGMIFNLGVGRRLTEEFDMRIEAPIFMIFSAPGEATAVAPTLTLTAGYRF
jgi:hypothetical protein